MRERTIVVGAGFAGLACAHALARAGREVVAFEGGPRAGGVVGSVCEGGFLFERAAHTILAGSPAFRRVVDELGLSGRLVCATPAARTRWLWHRGRLRALPASPPALVATDLLSWRAKRALLTEPLRRFVPPADHEPEPTLGAFLDERIGREASRLLAGAFVRGVHAAELDELGARSAFPRLWELATRHGSLVRGALARARTRPAPLAGPDLRRHALVSFPGGLQELVEALARELGPRLRLGARVVGLERLGSRWLVRTADGLGHPARAVVLACPAPAAARLLAAEVPRELSARALGVRHAAVTLVGLGFAPGTLDALPEGFGFLVPPGAAGHVGAAPRALGTIFVTNLFPDRAPRGARSVSSFYRAADVEGLDDAALARVAEADLALALGTAAPRAATVHVERWSEVIPRHAPGHAAFVDGLRRTLRERAHGLHVAGAWVDGVSVEQVLTSGRRAAEEVLGDTREQA
ncbi:MAG: protoporphyrinogen oxidase [Planctomycetes bacterium]|nr:protoporphyrinogen oxidase [Planctomycetota bacterium]